MRWLWRIFLLCLILGSVQWLHTHPDSSVTKGLSDFSHEVRDNWNNFLGVCGDYWHDFPTYMRNMLDTSPKPIRG